MPESAAISIIRSITPPKLAGHGRKRVVVAFESSFRTETAASDGDHVRCDRCLLSQHDGSCQLRYAAHSE